MATYDRRTGPRDRSLRVGDAERDAVVEILRREHVNGRLDAVEFQERLDRSLAAKTYADLDALLADLPSERPPARRGLAWSPRPWPIGIIPLLVVAAIVASHGSVLWLAFPLLAFCILRPLFWRSWGRGYRGYWRW
jgi:Arc/MetJ family transcription regulator